MEFKVQFLSQKVCRRLGWVGMEPDLWWSHAHWCPACSTMHDFAVEQPFTNGAHWRFDGNAASPTFTPSMNIKIGPYPDGKIERCHYILTAGVIQYCGDCTHELVGKHVPLPDIPADQMRTATRVPF